MDIATLVKHPEYLDRETLYDLRSTLALYPFYQTARLLMLQNLYLLHDSSFDEELRKAAIYITDRHVLFNLVEAMHYQLKRESKSSKEVATKPQEDRTISLIDNFLDSIPKEEEKEPKTKRKPTPADATVDYVAYLLQSEEEESKQEDERPQLIGHDLIDNFINNEGGKIKLKDEPEFKPRLDEEEDAEKQEHEESYFTETLAKIYIKQGRYAKALEIIQRLNLNYPKKNAYFADQIRFLEKLILNNKVK